MDRITLFSTKPLHVCLALHLLTLVTTVTSLSRLQSFEEEKQLTSICGNERSSRVAVSFCTFYLRVEILGADMQKLIKNLV